MNEQTWSSKVREWIDALSGPSESRREIAKTEMEDFARLMSSAEADGAIEAFTGPRYAAGIDRQLREVVREFPSG